MPLRSNFTQPPTRGKGDHLIEESPCIERRLPADPQNPFPVPLEESLDALSAKGSCGVGSPPK